MSTNIGNLLVFDVLPRNKNDNHDIHNALWMRRFRSENALACAEKYVRFKSEVSTRAEEYATEITSINSPCIEYFKQRYRDTRNRENFAEATRLDSWQTNAQNAAKNRQKELEALIDSLYRAHKEFELADAAYTNGIKELAEVPTLLRKTAEVEITNATTGSANVFYGDLSDPTSLEYGYTIVNSVGTAIRMRVPENLTLHPPES